MSSQSITGKSSLCLIIGDPVSHSLSPVMHNAAYAALRIPFVMAAARVEASALRAALHGMRALNIRGLAVTMPHKVAIQEFLDSVDPIAQTIGAVNTVVHADGTLTGYNTDWLGILRPLERVTSLAHKKVAILGAGGAAKAAIHAAKQGGASVTVFNRTLSTAEELASAFACSAGPLEHSDEIARNDIIINTTSLGMIGNEASSPLPQGTIRAHHIVFETIYSPAITTLLKDAQLVGAKIIQGAEMFLEQGAAQFELHTGVKAPREVMSEIISAS